MGRRARLDVAEIDDQRMTTQASGYADWSRCPKCGAAWEREPAINHCRMCGLTIANGGRLSDQIKYERSYGLARHTVDPDKGTTADRKDGVARKRIEDWDALWRPSS